MPLAAKMVRFQRFGMETSASQVSGNGDETTMDSRSHLFWCEGSQPFPALAQASMDS